MAGLNVLGLEAAAAEGHRLWMLNSVRVPDGVDEARVRHALLLDHGIEIGAGLGPWKGKVWRIGLMGESSQRENVKRVLIALGTELASGETLTREAVSAAEAI
jgi:alanine-glyoxylate transaminase/serine-glyoxylate transaminase/serine-pyruvate transaminase